MNVIYGGALTSRNFFCNDILSVARSAITNSGWKSNQKTSPVIKTAKYFTPTEYVTFLSILATNANSEYFLLD